MGFLNYMKRQIKTYIGLVIYAFLMLVYVPFYLIGSMVVYKELWKHKLKKAFGFRYRKFGKLGLVSRRNRVTDVSAVSTDNEIDFITYRSPCYIRRMCFRMPWELVRTILREEKVSLISDEQLVYVIMNTVFGNSVTWDEKREMFSLYMEGFDDLLLFEGFFWEARKILVSPDGGKIIIEMSNGEEYHSDCEDHLRPTFDLAKLHAQVCLSYFAPGLSHNHVHFVLPSAVAVLSNTILNRKGVLYKLLYPHFRFTERINYQALRIQKATNNKRSLDRLVFFWQPFPLTKEQFLEGVAKKCKIHYVDKGCKDCRQQEHEEGDENHEKSNGYSSSNCKRPRCIAPEIKIDDLEARTHTLFPPDFVTDENLQKIPYLNFLAQYYVVVREFVKSMIPYIDKKEWELLSNQVAEHVPRFAECNMVDAIATFIHQVGVIHFCDHNSYLRYFAFRYSCMALRVPFEPFENVNDWKEFEEEFNIDMNEVKQNPVGLIRQRDVLRTRSFMEIFGDFIPSSNLDLQLINTEYGFEEKGAQMAVDNFKSKLRQLDGNLKGQKPIFSLSRQEGEQRGQGMRIVPLDDIVRSVCY